MAPAKIDWAEAKAYWLNLGHGRRSYREVARKFPISATGVRKHATLHDWPAQAIDFDRAVDERALEIQVRTRAQRVVKALRVVDRYMDVLDSAGKAAEVKPADLPALVKLAELLEGEATDRVALSEVQGVIVTVVAIAGEFVPHELRPRFMERLGEATAGLVALEANGS